MLGVGGVHHDNSPHGTVLGSLYKNKSRLPSLSLHHITHIPRTVMIRASSMAIPIKASLLALILLLVPLSSGMADGFKDGTSPIYLLHKDGSLMNSNLELDAVLDYDYAGANPKHDPRKGKPGNGGGGKNP